MADGSEYVFKVLMLGDSGVGKTHLRTRFVKGSVASHTEPTIGVDFSSKPVEMGPDTTVRLQIWDAAGAKRYRSHDPGKVYKHAVCVLLVYDVTAEESFNSLDSWMNELKATSEIDTSRMVFIVVGNKCDLPDHAVTATTASTYAKARGFLFQEVSADKNEGVTELFTLAASSILKRLAVPSTNGTGRESPTGSQKQPRTSQDIKTCDESSAATPIDSEDETPQKPQQKPQHQKPQQPQQQQQRSPTPPAVDATPTTLQQTPAADTDTEDSSAPGTRNPPPALPEKPKPVQAKGPAIPQPDPKPGPPPKKSKNDKHDGCQCCLVQ